MNGFLLNSKFFKQLFGNEQEVSNGKMQGAYESFMEQIKMVSQTEKDLSEVFRMLNITRIELVFSESLYRCGQGGKMP
jgi:hypothetical protein